MSKKTQNEKQSPYPPVVVVLGHVDHGKTTLLDAIRKTNVAAREHGSITQRIGASKIWVTHENKQRAITFIDTPGHEAFSLMRARGAQASDIGLLVVSAVDGVMPQTRESIQLFQKGKTPFIVVLTKVDLLNRAVAKTKQQLSKEGVLVEELGGDVPVIEVSAKTGKHVQELLELILLVFDIQSVRRKKKETDPFEGVVIESKLDQKVGPRATVVVRGGRLSVRDEVVADGVEGRVRTLINDSLEHVVSATVGDAVEVLGFGVVVQVGSLVTMAAPAKEISKVERSPSTSATPHFEEEYLLLLILCVDTLGSLEAIVSSLPKGVYIVSQKTGGVSKADVLLAKSTGAIILTFNVAVKHDVVRFAQDEKVLLKHYTVIYELLTEVKEVLAGKQIVSEVKTLGVAKVQAVFPFEKTRVAGVVVVEGRVAKGDRVKVTREEALVGESTITSLRQGKTPVSRVEKGEEAGVLLAPALDFTIGDVLTSQG